jgi:uncharacterized protein YaaR (DUF327 family)
MVKIERNRRNNGNLIKFDKPVNEVASAHKSDFAQDLLEKERQSYHQRMQELLVDIDKCIKALADNLNLNDLMRYKKLVQSFLKEATACAYLVNKESSFTRRGARSILITVKMINQEVESLLREFANLKRDPMDVLETLDKIRGMLVDLLV